MAVSQKEIVESCKKIIETLNPHTTKTISENLFITAYQIWETLKENDHAICEHLIDDCGGDFVGKGAGSNIGPAQKIARSLGQCPEIETQYINTKYLTIAEITPSGTDCGLFRLR